MTHEIRAPETRRPEAAAQRSAALSRQRPTAAPAAGSEALETSKGDAMGMASTGAAAAPPTINTTLHHRRPVIWLDGAWREVRPAHPSMREMDAADRTMRDRVGCTSVAHLESGARLIVHRDLMGVWSYWELAGGDAIPGAAGVAELVAAARDMVAGAATLGVLPGKRARLELALEAMLPPAPAGVVGPEQRDDVLKREKVS